MIVDTQNGFIYDLYACKTILSEAVLFPYDALATWETNRQIQVRSKDLMDEAEARMDELELS
jgi:hypothetical protein